MGPRSVAHAPGIRSSAVASVVVWVAIVWFGSGAAAFEPNAGARELAQRSGQQHTHAHEEPHSDSEVASDVEEKREEEEEAGSAEVGDEPKTADSREESGKRKGGCC